MIRKVSFTAFALLSCSAAIAAPAEDKRIRTQAYSPDHIVQILGRSGIQSTIEFAPDERIENVAVGDSSAWQITPNRRASLLFVKPLTPRSRTNMTVVTDRRTYMFDLVAGDKWTTPVYALKFSYPNEPKRVETGPAPIQQAAAAPVAGESTATMTADKLHFDWNKKGNGKLLPARVFDDGSALYLAWDKETPLPAILTVSEDRKEGPVNYRMSGDYIVISPIPANLVLRYGSKFAELWPSHRVVPQRPATTAVAGRMASAPATQVRQPLAQPAAAQPTVNQSPVPAANTTSSAVKLANMTSLYSDKLTGADHEN
jgi:type IV secretion system protein VirB9